MLHWTFLGYGMAWVSSIKPRIIGSNSLRRFAWPKRPELLLSIQSSSLGAQKGLPNSCGWDLFILWGRTMTIPSIQSHFGALSSRSWEQPLLKTNLNWYGLSRALGPRAAKRQRRVHPNSRPKCNWENPPGRLPKSGWRWMTLSSGTSKHRDVSTTAKRVVETKTYLNDGQIQRHHHPLLGNHQNEEDIAHQMYHPEINGHKILPLPWWPGGLLSATPSSVSLNPLLSKKRQHHSE